MAQGASYWGNGEGKNDECCNKAGRPSHYPGAQEKGKVTNSEKTGQKDSQKVPMENC